MGKLPTSVPPEAKVLGYTKAGVAITDARMLELNELAHAQIRAEYGSGKDLPPALPRKVRHYVWLGAPGRSPGVGGHSPEKDARLNQVAEKMREKYGKSKPWQDRRAEYLARKQEGQDAR